MYYATKTTAVNDDNEKQEVIFAFQSEAKVEGSEELKSFDSIADLLEYVGDIPLQTDIEELQPNYEAIEKARRDKSIGDRLKRHGFANVTEAVAGILTDLDDIKGGGGASVLSALVELARKQDVVIRAGVSYPSIQKAAVTVFERDNPKTAADGLEAVLEEILP